MYTRTDTRTHAHFNPFELIQLWHIRLIKYSLNLLYGTCIEVALWDWSIGMGIGGASEQATRQKSLTNNYCNDAAPCICITCALCVVRCASCACLFNDLYNGKSKYTCDWMFRVLVPCLFIRFTQKFVEYKLIWPNARATGTNINAIIYRSFFFSDAYPYPSNELSWAELRWCVKLMLMLPDRIYVIDRSALPIHSIYILSCLYNSLHGISVSFLPHSSCGGEVEGEPRQYHFIARSL